MKRQAKYFEYNGEKCLQIGTVQMTMKEFENTFQCGEKSKFCIVTEDRFYFPEKMAKGNVTYSIERKNGHKYTMPHRYFCLDKGLYKDYSENV